MSTAAGWARTGAPTLGRDISTWQESKALIVDINLVTRPGTSPLLKKIRSKILCDRGLGGEEFVSIVAVMLGIEWIFIQLLQCTFKDIFFNAWRNLINSHLFRDGYTVASIRGGLVTSKGQWAYPQD